MKPDYQSVLKYELGKGIKFNLLERWFKKLRLLA